MFMILSVFASAAGEPEAQTMRGLHSPALGGGRPARRLIIPALRHLRLAAAPQHVDRDKRVRARSLQVRNLLGCQARTVVALEPSTQTRKARKKDALSDVRSIEFVS